MQAEYNAKKKLVFLGVVEVPPIFTYWQNLFFLQKVALFYRHIFVNGIAVDPEGFLNAN